MTGYNPFTLFSSTLERDGHGLDDAELGRLARLMLLIMRSRHGRMPTDLHWLAKQLVTSQQHVQALYEPLLESRFVRNAEWYWHPRLYNGLAFITGVTEVQQARIRGAWNMPARTIPEPTISDRAAFRAALCEAKRRRAAS